MNYWKYLKIISSGLIVVAVIIAGINSGGPSTKMPIETGTKFNF